MAETTLAEQLAEAIALLTKVSTQQTKKEKKYSTVAKVTKVEEEKEQKVDNTEKMVEKLSKVITAEQAKPKEVVEEGKPVSIVDIDKKVMTKLGKIFTPPEAEREQVDMEKEGGGLMKWLRMLIGPALLILGGLASFVMGLFSQGPLKGVFTLLGKLGIRKVLQDMAIKLGKFLIGKKILRRLPIIGAVLSFVDAYFRFTNNDPVGGSIALLEGLASLLDLAVPGLGMTLSFGLGVLNAILDYKTAGAEDITDAKLNILKDWTLILGEAISKLPIFRHLLLFSEGFGDIVNGDFKEGFLKMAYSVPFFGVFADLFALPETHEEAVQQTKGKSFSEIFNKAMQPLYGRILTLLPDWMQDLMSVDDNGNLFFTPGKMVESLANKVTDFLGLSNAKERAISKQAETAAIELEKRNKDIAIRKLKERIRDINLEVEQLDEADSRRIQLLREKHGLRASLEKKYGITGVNVDLEDSIMTPEGKTLQPGISTTSSMVKTKNPIGEYLNKSTELTTKSNNLLEEMSDTQEDLLTKQLKQLEKNNQLLLNMFEKLQQPSNNTQANVINNTFGDNISLRNLQAIAT